MFNYYEFYLTVKIIMGFDGNRRFTDVGQDIQTGSGRDLDLNLVSI